MTKLEENDHYRFWTKVDIAGPDDCWEWTAAHTVKGYGRFRIRDKLYGANRLSLSEYLGVEIEELREVCHTCDNPPCVNPSHLFDGSKSDNMLDCVKKGRHKTVSMRGYRADIRTHCVNGHEYSIVGQLPKSGYCRECNRLKMQKLRSK